MLARWTGGSEVLCPLDISSLATWVEGIPLTEWPQQSRVSAKSNYPAMVATHREDWFDITRVVKPVFDHILPMFPGSYRGHSMLSLLVPGQSIEGHTDVQSPAWKLRIHVPITTNPGVTFHQEGQAFHMAAGFAYKFNPEVEHVVKNLGSTNRVHLFFDILSTET